MPAPTTAILTVFFIICLPYPAWVVSDRFQVLILYCAGECPHNTKINGFMTWLSYLLETL
jgi:hypothetical protein